MRIKNFSLILAGCILFFASCTTKKTAETSAEAKEEKAPKDTIALTGDSLKSFANEPKFIHPDPNFNPGDFPLAEVGNARVTYYNKKYKWLKTLDANSSVTVDIGEIFVTAMKNETNPVLGYFRSYFGILRTNEKGIASADILIDVNSYDSGVPGRNNRILNIFFESMKLENSAIEVKFNQFETDTKDLNELADGHYHIVKANGTLMMNGVTKNISASVSVKKDKNTWMAETVHPVVVLISDFAFGDKANALMKSCNHKSIGNAVKVDCKLFFR